MIIREEAYRKAIAYLGLLLKEQSRFLSNDDIVAAVQKQISTDTSPVDHLGPDLKGEIIEALSSSL